MKIRRFNESTEDIIDISSERVGEMLDELRSSISNIDSQTKLVDAIMNELENFKNKSTKGNDQVDDSISSFQIIKSNLEDTVDKMDIVINNLIDYNENGRKFLYTEK